MMYVADSRELMPLPNWASVDRYAGWLYEPPLRYNYHPDRRKGGVLWPYLQQHDMYRCPDHLPPYTRTQNLTSYLMTGAIVSWGRRQPPPFQIHMFRNDAIIIWEAGADTDGWNDGSSYPYEGLTQRHTKGATVSCIDGHTEFFSHKQFDNEVNKSPGRLWCNPESESGH